VEEERKGWGEYGTLPRTSLHFITHCAMNAGLRDGKKEREKKRNVQIPTTGYYLGSMQKSV
jgi:hypothetical protein